MVKDKLHELVDVLPEQHIQTVESFLKYLVEEKTQKQNNDLTIFDSNSEYLNEEAADVLTYQVSL